MGGIRRQRKKILTPGHPYDKIRIDQELPLVGEYGLRNKKELWKARTILSKARQQARALLALPIDTRKHQEKELISSLVNLGMLTHGSDLDSVLALDVRTVLNRRLQTIVYKKGLASTPYQARQFIIHRHISLDRAVITSPGRLIKVIEEENIEYAPKSPLLDSSHPARPHAPPVSAEIPLVKKEIPKGRQKPKVLRKDLLEEIEEEEEEIMEEEFEEEEDLKEELKAKPKPEVKKEVPKPEVKKEVPKPEVKKEVPKPEVKKEVPKIDLSEIKGVGAKTAMLLKESGFDSVEKIASSSEEDLSKVPGIGDATAKTMISEAKNLLTKAKEGSK